MFQYAGELISFSRKIGLNPVFFKCSFVESFNIGLKFEYIVFYLVP